MKSPFKRPAFTLVELLIVITIIGILAVALVPRISGGPARARDAKRQADLNTISLGLELYANDNGGEYPESACLSGENADLDSYMTGGVPSEPSESNAWPAGICQGEAGYVYTKLTPNGTSQGYLLIAKLENPLATGENIYRAGSISLADTDVTAASILDAGELCGGTDVDCSAGAVYIIGR